MINSTIDRHPKRLTSVRNIGHEKSLPKDFSLHSQFKNKQSLKFNISKKPLFDPSFKGFSLQGIGNVIRKEVFSLSKEPAIFNESLIKEAYNHIDGAIGKGTKELLEQTISDINKHLEQDVKGIIIPQKTFICEFGDNLIRPVINLPASIGNFGLDIVHTFGGKKFVESVRNSNPEGYLNRHRKNVEIQSKMNAVKGYLEQLDEWIINGNSAKSLDSSVTDQAVQAKMDKKLFNMAHELLDRRSKGNYSTTAERVLTRFTSGGTAAVFLATDAYNLSRLCKDDHNEAQKEKNSRFKQELGRLGLTGYLTFLTFSSLKKFTNKSLQIALTVGMFSTVMGELVGRKLAKKPILPVSKEQAVRMSDDPPVMDPLAGKPLKSINRVMFNSSQGKVSSFNISDTKIKELQALVRDSEGSSISFKASTEKKKRNTKAIATALGAYALIGVAFFKKKEIGALLERAGIAELVKSARKPFADLRKRLITKEEYIEKKVWDNFIKAMKDVENDKLVEQYEKLVKDAADGRKYLGKSERLWLKSIIDTGIVFPFKFAKGVVEFPFAKAQGLFKLAIRPFKAKTGLADLEKEFITGNLQAKFQEALTSKVSYDTKKDIAREILKKLEKKDSTGEILNKTENKNLGELIKDIEGANCKTEYITKVRNELSVAKQFKIAEDFVSDNKAQEAKLAAVADDVKKKIAKDLLKSNEDKNLNELVDDLEKAGIKADYLAAVKKEASKEADLKADLSMLRDALRFYEQNAKKVNKEKMTYQELIKKFREVPLMAMDNTGKSNFSNAELGILMKFWATSLTGAFLVADSYNLVMQKTHGKNQDMASQKAKERATQELFRNFYSSYMIKLIQDAFKVHYNSSLFASQLIVIGGYLLCESFTRLSVGLPIKSSSKQEILDMEEKNNNKKGLIGNYHRFMAEITGKKALSSRLDDKQKVQVQNNQIKVTA